MNRIMIQPATMLDCAKKMIKYFPPILFFILNSCVFSDNHPSGTISRLSWDAKPNTLLFYYFYNAGSSYHPETDSPLYQLPIDKSPEKPLKTITDKKLEDLLSTFSHLGRSYLLEHLKELKPYGQEHPVQISSDEYIQYTSYQAKINLMLAAHINKNASEASPKMTYSIVNTQDKTYRDLQYLDAIGDTSHIDKKVLIRWTGFDNDVLVEFTKNQKMNHALAKIDLSKGMLTNLRVFKTYDLKEDDSRGSWVALSYIDFQRAYIDKNYLDVKVLGWETPDIVYYLEKKPNANQVDLVKYDFISQSALKIASMDANNSYYPYLNYHEQISISQKKVAFVVGGPRIFMEDLMVADLDGTNQKHLLNRIQDLPLGNPIPVQ